MAKQKLTPKMEAFIRHFVINGDPEAAYRVAYDSLTMEDRTVRMAAAKVLKHPLVKSRLADVRATSGNLRPMPKPKPTRRRMNKALTSHQLKFAEAVALGNDATAAYRMAYDASGMVEGAIRSSGSKLTRHKAVRAKIDELKERAAQIAADRFDVSMDDVIQAAAAILKSNPTDYYSWGSRKVPAVNRKTGTPIVDEHGEQVFDDKPYVRIKNSKDLTRRQLAAVTGAEMTYSASGQAMVRVSTGDRLKAAALLASVLAKANEASPAVCVTVNNNTLSVGRPDGPSLTPHEAMKRFEEHRAKIKLAWDARPK